MAQPKQESVRVTRRPVLVIQGRVDAQHRNNTSVGQLFIPTNDPENRKWYTSKYDKWASNTKHTKASDILPASAHLSRALGRTAPIAQWKSFACRLVCTSAGGGTSNVRGSRRKSAKLGLRKGERHSKFWYRPTSAYNGLVVFASAARLYTGRRENNNDHVQPGRGQVVGSARNTAKRGRGGRNENNAWDDEQSTTTFTASFCRARVPDART